MFGNFGKMALIRSIIKTRSMEGSEHGNSSGIWERRPDPSRRCVLLGRLSVRPWRMYRIEARLRSRGVFDSRFFSVSCSISLPVWVFQ